MNKDTIKPSIGIIFGGVSSEYEISLLSATSILQNINSERYDLYMVGITKAGNYLLYTGDIDRIKDDTWQGEDCTPCIISPNRQHHGILLLGETVAPIRLDCVFPVLHGKNGEDGTIQGLLELASIPYVGCGVLSSASCMDKTVTKAMLDSKKIANAKWVGINRKSYLANPTAFHEKVEFKLGFPCFVKPANAGSSVGITKATDALMLEKAIELALFHDSKVLVEQCITGIELECAVLGNDDPIASCLGEIVPGNTWYDYDAKYVANSTKSYIPARIDEAVSDKIRSTAIKAYKLMGCSGLARIDFFLSESEDEIILNEINTLPGFTSISMYPKLFEASGIPYGDLIDKLIEYGINKNL